MIIQKNSEIMHKFLNADGSVIGNIIGTNESQLSLKLRNVHPLPLMVDSILLNDRNILEESFTLQGLPLFSPVRDGVNNTIKLDLNVSDKTEFENFKNILSTQGDNRRAVKNQI